MNRREFFAANAALAVVGMSEETADERMARRVEYWMKLADEGERQARLNQLLYGPLPNGPAIHIYPTSFLQ